MNLTIALISSGFPAQGDGGEPHVAGRQACEELLSLPELF
jgi:hypothetical protein